MEARVVVYARDAETIEFLRSFFARRRGLQTEFTDNPASLAKAFSGNDLNPLCIAPVEELGKLRLPGAVSVIATITNHTRDN
ncbi:MAG TPA: hypothetical protein VF790_14490, partial [Dissulfurispiraceae bacterium]